MREGLFFMQGERDAELRVAAATGLEGYPERRWAFDLIRLFDAYRYIDAYRAGLPGPVFTPVNVAVLDSGLDTSSALNPAAANSELAGIQINYWDLGVAVVTIALLLGLPRLLKRVPVPLVALTAVSLRLRGPGDPRLAPVPALGDPGQSSLSPCTRWLTSW